MPTSKQRAFLLGEAQYLYSILQVGKAGVSENLLIDADAAVTARELVKGNVLENSPLDAREAANEIAEGLGADVVQVIGRKFVIYRESDAETQRHYDLEALKTLQVQKPVKKKVEKKPEEPKKTVKPGYKKKAARERAEAQRKIEKEEKAKYFREKAREERRQAALAGTPVQGSDYKIIKKKKLPYKSSLITYTLAFLSLKCSKKLDLLRIWRDQEMNDDLMMLLSAMVDDVYSALIDSPENYPDIRMWSRKAECWERIKSISREYDIPYCETAWEFLPENAAKLFIEKNFKNRNLWIELEKWHHSMGAILNESQISLVHGMPSIIFKDEKGLKKITKKQEAFAKSIFLVAVENGFEYEKIVKE